MNIKVESKIWQNIIFEDILWAYSSNEKKSSILNIK